jgi:hypothetical protein
MMALLPASETPPQRRYAVNVPQKFFTYTVVLPPPSCASFGQRGPGMAHRASVTHTILASGF